MQRFRVITIRGSGLYHNTLSPRYTKEIYLFDKRLLNDWQTTCRQRQSNHWAL